MFTHQGAGVKEAGAVIAGAQAPNRWAPGGNNRQRSPQRWWALWVHGGAGAARSPLAGQREL